MPVTEPVGTSACYDPQANYTPPQGRLPVLGKKRAEIDLLRAQADNQRNEVVNRDLAQIDSNNLITEQIAASQAKTTRDDSLATETIAASQAKTTNETNIAVEQVRASGVSTANDTTRTVNDTTRATNDTNRSIAEIANSTNKTDAEVNLLAQKKETELAQVSDTVATGTVVGVIGKQKALFQKQTDGFDRDAEQKLTKIMIDTWSVRQTTDGADAGLAGIAEADIAAVVSKARDGINAPVTP